MSAPPPAATLMSASVRLRFCAACAVLVPVWLAVAWALGWWA